MRKIKFRVWEFEAKEFIYLNPEKEKFDTKWLVSDAQSICLQYTGIVDSKGNEIYEGDILENKLWEMKAKVIWDTKCFYGWCVTTDYDEDECLDNMADIHPIISDRQCTDECSMQDCIIIGNIYENPELFT